MMKDPLLSLSLLHGEGRVTCRALKAAGFLTLRSVATTSLEDLSERARLSARSARRLQDGAREMIRQGGAADLASAPLRTRPRRPAPSQPPRPLPPPLSGPPPCFSQGVTADELRVLRGEDAAPPGSKPAPGA